jgi:hypothetical protein
MRRVHEQGRVIFPHASTARDIEYVLSKAIGESFEVFSFWFDFDFDFDGGLEAAF